MAPVAPSIVSVFDVEPRFIGGTETYARAKGQWSSYDDAHNVASPAGKNFSALIASLGGPPGKVEG